MVSFAYSPEKEKLLVPLIKEFNSSQKDVFVEGSVVSSGEAERKIAQGKLETVAWSPASSLWGRLLNSRPTASWPPPRTPRSRGRLS